MGDARYLDLPDSASQDFIWYMTFRAPRKGIDVKLGKVLLFVGGKKENKCKRED